MNTRILGAAIAAVALAGCGGSSSNNSTPPTGGGVTGDTTTPVLDANSPGAVNSLPGAATPVTLTVNGTNEGDAVPGGESIPAGSDVLLIPPTLPVNLNETSAGIARPHQIVPDQARTAGEIYLFVGSSFVDAGLYVFNGQIVGSGNKVYAHYVFAYPSAGGTRNIRMLIQGPVILGSGSSFLTVGTGVEFDFQISNGGLLGAGHQSTYPTAALYALPANGQSLFESFLKLNLGRLSVTNAIPTSVEISWPGTIKNQTRTTNGGLTTIWSAGNTVTNVIPSTGIDQVTVTVQAP